MRSPWLLGAAAVGVVFAPVLLGETFFYSDYSLLYHPLKRWQIETMAAGSAPWWNPLHALGLPQVANPLAGTFYPPHLLLLVLPFTWGLNAIAVLHVALALYGGVRLMRALEADDWSGLLTGAAFALGGPMVSSTSYMFSLFAWAWAPLALEGAVRRKVGQTAIALALTLLAGAPLVFVTTLGLCALLAPSLALVAASALALGLAAVQLAPTAFFLPYSDRAEGARAALIWSFAPERMLGFALPDFWGRWGPTNTFWGRHLTDGRNDGNFFFYSHYVGVVPLVLAPLAMKRLRWLAVAVPVCLLLAFGSHTPLYGWLLEAVPGFGLFRYPEKWVMPVTLVLAVLGGAGCAAVAEARRDVRIIATAVALSIIAAAVWVLVDDSLRGTIDAHSPVPMADVARPVQQLGAARALVVAVLAVVLLWSRPRPALLALLALVDVGVAHRPLVWTAPAEVLEGAAPMAELLKGRSGGTTPVVARHPLLNRTLLHRDLPGLARVVQRHGASFRENMGLEAGARTLHASSPAKVAHDRDLEAWFWDDPRDAGRVLGVRFVLLPIGAPAPTGYAQRVRVAAVGVDVAEYEGDLLPEVFCATEAGPYACATASDDGWVVDASTPVVLVRRQAWAPGWSVDGRPVEQVLGTLQAVPLGAGRHTVRFEYEPPGLALGASLSLLSLLVLVWLRARRRREDE